MFCDHVIKSNKPMHRSALMFLAAGLFLWPATPARSQEFGEDELDFASLSIEELMNIEVTSVSKKAQSKQSAAAAITVITAEDIRRGGFTVIPEALRMVPGMSVGRVDANRWAISIRGNAGLFSNKLLVLIDGRTVYRQTPQGFADHIPELVDAGAAFLGGCCGTSPDFIAAVVKKLGSA